jgi:tripartite-type tricarboxylate transporter receptor subunit TctC
MRLHTRIAAAAAAVATSLGVFAAPAAAQDWKPTQPIRVIVPYQPVGTSDIIARAISEGIPSRLGQTMVVENRAGGMTQIGTSAVATAPPDGHTLLIVANTFAVNPSLLPKLPYDPDTDLAPITYAGVTPHTLVVHPSLPVHTLAELVEYARKNPGKLSYGSVGNGTSFHLGMEELKQRTGISLVHIPYKGMGPVLADLMGNNVQVAFANTPNIVQYVQSGKLRAIAVAHPTRVAQLPDVPTVAEYGLKGFESNSWFVFFAPGKTPPNILDTLNKTFVDILNEPKTRNLLTEQGVEVMATSRAEAAAFVRRETDKYAKVVKFAGIKID